MWKKYKNWVKLIKWIKNHRENGNYEFEILTNEDTIVITVCKCENTEGSWKKNMLRLNY